MAERVAPKELNYSDVLPLAIESKSQRRKFFPVNGDTFSTTGTNIIRLDINADSLLDTSHSYLQFNLVQGAGQTLGVDQGLPMFQRLRIESGGVVLEDITEYGRLVAMLNQCQGGPSQANEQSVQVRANNPSIGGTNGFSMNHNSNTQIAGPSTNTFAVSLPSALFNLSLIHI